MGQQRYTRLNGNGSSSGVNRRDAVITSASGSSSMHTWRSVRAHPIHGESYFRGWGTGAEGTHALQRAAAARSREGAPSTWLCMANAAAWRTWLHGGPWRPVREAPCGAPPSRSPICAPRAKCLLIEAKLGAPVRVHNTLFCHVDSIHHTVSDLRGGFDQGAALAKDGQRCLGELVEWRLGMV